MILEQALFSYYRVHSIDLPWDINASSVTYNVWMTVCTIPYGETRYYKDVASMVGRPRGARAAGQALM
jgi:O6-methylguanine-DNA--protein-cysteine methyltransferase